GASHAAAGMLCPVTEVHYGEEPLLALTLDSARRWPQFAAGVLEASGLDIGYRTDGTLLVAFDDDDLRLLDELLRFQRSLGLAVDDVPVRPVKGQILRLRFDPADPPLTKNVRGFAEGRSVYLVPRADGELVVGATVEELGYDTAVTVGAVHDLLRAATDLVPGVAELELVETHAGLRPGTPDNAPILGVSARD